MGGNQVVHWKKFGQERLYVNRADGSSIGHWDLRSDEAKPATEKDRLALTAAVMVWRESRAKTPDSNKTRSAAAAVPAEEQAQGPEPSVPMPQPVVESEVEPPVVESSLASNLPGAAARAEADRLRREAPLPTRLAKYLGIATEETAWRVGAKGEVKVGAQLARLVRKDSRWKCLHAVGVGANGADIDHVVIGPGGVFTLNAKHHRGARIWVGGDAIMVNGQLQHYVRNSRWEVRRAAQLLSHACGFPVEVEGMIVPVGFKELDVKTKPLGVYIVPVNRLARWLRATPDVLATEQVEAIFKAADRPSTWQPKKRGASPDLPSR